MTEERIQESRRRLLKIIAATSGAVAASTVLPGAWLKPVVEMGVLPAHAQLSDRPLDLRDLRAFCDGCIEVAEAGASVSPNTISGTFNWQALCDFCASPDVYLTVTSDECGTILSKGKLGGNWYANIGGKKGTMWYGNASYCSSNYCSLSINQTDTIYAYLDGCGGRSNTDDVTIQKVNAS